MTPTAWLACVGCAALVAAALTVTGGRGAFSLSPAAVDAAPSCDSCTARHQRLSQRAATAEDATR
jgi:hypothetical protein